MLVSKLSCPRCTAPFKVVLKQIGVKSKHCSYDVSLGNAQTGKNRGSTALIPSGAAGDVLLRPGYCWPPSAPPRESGASTPLKLSVGRCRFSQHFQRRYRSFQLIETFVLTFIIRYKSLKVLSVKLPCHNIMTGHGIIVLLF